eukprot:568611-Alexandrium_andersonii.AAC.1
MSASLVGSEMCIRDRLFAEQKIYRKHVSLWDYNGESEKTLWLYTPFEFINELDEWATVNDRPKPKKLVKEVVKNGRKKVRNRNGVKHNR